MLQSMGSQKSQTQLKRLNNNKFTDKLIAPQKSKKKLPNKQEMGTFLSFCLQLLALFPDNFFFNSHQKGNNSIVEHLEKCMCHPFLFIPHDCGYFFLFIPSHDFVFP